MLRVGRFLSFEVRIRFERNVVVSWKVVVIELECERWMEVQVFIGAGRLAGLSE